MFRYISNDILNPYIFKLKKEDNKNIKLEGYLTLFCENNECGINLLIYFMK